MGNNCVNGREVKFCNAERDLDCMYSIRYLDFFSDLYHPWGS